MGRAMLARLRDRGVPATGFDSVPSRSETSALEELVHASDTIILSLPNAPVVDSVVTQIAACDPKDLVVIDTSTGTPETARRASKTLAALGVGFLDAPVSGGRPGAREGNLSFLVGGSKTTLEAMRPILGHLAKRIVHVGDVGAGQVAKLTNNLLVAIHLLGLSEAVRLGREAGVDADKLVEAVNACSGRSAVSEINFPRWIASGRFDSGFSMGLMRKDVRAALELASRLGIELPISELAGALWRESAARLDDGADFNRIAALDPPPLEPQ